MFNGSLSRSGGGDEDGGPPLVLLVSAAHGDGSLVAQASRDLLQNLAFPHETRRRDLWQDGRLVSYNLSHVAAKMRLLRGRGSEEDERLFAPVQELAEELNAARVLVVSTPMWNFSFPYVLKQYVDIAVQPGINFLEDPDRPVTGGKHLVVVSSCGGSYAEDNPRDHLGPYLR